MSSGSNSKARNEPVFVPFREFTDCPPTEADGSSILIVSTFIFGERDKIIKECQMSMTQYLTSSLAAQTISALLTAAFDIAIVTRD